VRDGDLVARTGGDEFVVLADLDEGSMPEDVAERILASLARPSSWPPAVHRHPEHRHRPLPHRRRRRRSADQERRRRHVPGQGARPQQLQFFDHGLSARYSERLELENRLRHALDEQQLAFLPAPGGHFRAS
jgi:GGDEF domain-containing protein